VVLLTDYDPTESDYANKFKPDDFMHINLTHVEKSVARLIDEEQSAVVVSAHHPLSRHKQLAAALWKARRSKSEQVLDQKGDKGEGVLGGGLFAGAWLLRWFRGLGWALMTGVRLRWWEGSPSLSRSLPRPPLSAQPSKKPKTPHPPTLSAARLGYHTLTHSSVDPYVLMEELALVADTLTHGLVGARC